MYLQKNGVFCNYPDELPDLGNLGIYFMIKILNISDNSSPSSLDEYEIWINKKLICSFKHERSPDGLSRCLRDAAEAVENDTDQIMRNSIITGFIT